jgi:hypothetical protein
MHTGRNSNRGQAIFPLVLILTAVFGLIGAAFAGAAYLQSLLSSQRAFAEQALQAAASGVDDALLRIARNRDWTDNMGYTVSVDGIDADVTVTDTTGMGTQLQRTIESTATQRGVTRGIEVIVEVSPNGGTKVLSRQELTD